MLRPMKESPTTEASTQPKGLRGWRRLLAILLLNVGAWGLFSVLGALTSLNDDLRYGVQGSYWLILQHWGYSSIVLACQSLVLYACFTRWPQWVASAKRIAWGFGLQLLLLLPLQMIFLLKLYVREDGPGLSWAALEQQVLAIDKFTSLLHLTSTTAVYFSVVALKIWQQHQARTRAWEKAQADGVALRLELERQRGLVLRAQLEPHFLFNALNAISSMVRSDKKDVALQGIHGLSDLLRYALTASDKTWVLLRDELAFVEDYLALQRMRYGARLQISIEGIDDAVLACDCPPLLMQPLVENALRHDLDCHTKASDIRMSFACHDEQLSIRISNPVHAEAASNPGAGLGLRNTEARLRLAYGTAATITAGIADGRFEVTIHMSAHEPE